jgi:cytochrome c oxidase assembly protein subunit 15
MRHLARLAPASWSVLAFNVLVIAWGAYVRASGSGAGCGRHWPTCNGDVVPHAPRVATMIEFSHRLSSGAALILVWGLAFAAYRAHRTWDRVTKAAVASGVLVSFEAVIGAGLVLFELVAHDASMKRALSVALHLSNTFFLLGALALTAWWAGGGAALRVRRRDPLAWICGVPLALMVVVGTSGAVAALGDTLFPSKSLADGFAQDLSTGAHIFIRLRLIHPVLAATTAMLALAAAAAVRILRPTPNVRMASYATTVAVVSQVALGLANVYFLAPVWMQLVHLVLADVVWVSLVVMTASALAVDSSTSVVTDTKQLAGNAAVP